MAKKENLGEMLDGIYEVVKQRRKHGDPDSSYVAGLIHKGRKKMCEKVGEEAFELVIDAVDGKRKRTISESADLLFHLLVLWEDMKITPSDVAEKLAERKGVSGNVEKASRKK